MSGAVGRRNLRTLAVLLAIPVGVALFALFAFRPLYTLWCNATGTGMRPNVAVVGTGDGREIEVLFRSQVFDGLPLRFAPDESRQVVVIGEDAHAVYRLENTSDRTLRIRPIHQVSPINAARHFGMKVCFCFNDQDIEPHGVREFPVVYAFAPALDRRIETVTLCYSLFDVAPGTAPSKDMERIEREVREYGEIVSPRRPDARP